MDPATLAAGAVALLGAFLAKAASEFAEEGGKAAWRLASSLLGRLRSAVKRSKHDEEILEHFSREPASAAPEAQEMLENILAADPGLAEDVARILAEVKQLGPQVSVVQRIKEAEDLVGVRARRFHRGSVEVEQEADKGKRITGVVIDDIGD